MALHAQNGTIKGLLKDEENHPLVNANVKLLNTEQVTQSDASGSFMIENIPFGTYQLELSADHFNSTVLEIVVDKALTELPEMTLQQESSRNSLQDNTPVVELNESELNESSSQNVASALSASRDAFNSAATFSWSIARFRVRGYEDENFITYMNGSPMSDLTSGRTLFNTWSGLNDVMRNRESVNGLNPANFSYSAIGGSFSIDSRASRQRKQLQASFSLSNRSYDNRVMLTYGTGIMKSGWAFSFSGSHRWAGEGYSPGTFMDAWAYFASAEKIFNLRHSVAITLFGSPMTNGRSSPSTQEMYDLAGTNYYNPAWGYQDGKKRNSRVGRNHQPVMIFSHEFNINPKSSLNTSLSVLKGKTKLSGLDWLDAPDPRPDYYRNLPSYYYAQNFITTGDYLKQLLSTDETARQINWDELYQRNFIAGDTAIYVVEDRITENNIISLNSVYNRMINDRLNLTAGLAFTKQVSTYYKEVNDLLGAKYFIDINKFAQQDFPDNPDAFQNNLDEPNRLLNKGDKYGYEYSANITRPAGWLQGIYKLDKVDFFGAVELSSVSFYRNGKVRNGLFPDSSLAKSATQSFFNYAVKGGITYKINGRNYVFANGSLLTRAPYFENAFVSARTRNQVAPNLENENIKTAEGGYLLRAPKLKIKAVAWITQFNNGIRTVSFFSESNSAYVNYTETHINKKHSGIELGADAALGKGFSASGAASLGEYYFSSRPVAVVTQDNLAQVIAASDTVFVKNIRVAGSPQQAYNFGLNYRSRKFWYVNLSINYFDGIYVDYFPGRRNREAIDLVEEGSDQWNAILGQEKMDGQLTVDFFGGWSYKLNNKFKSLKRNTFVVLNAGVNNLLNNKKFRTGGFEYSRFNSAEDLATFTSKYIYAYGTTFFVNLTLRFN